MLKSLPVVSIILILQLFSTSWAQIYSDTDTMSEVISSGYPSDTVAMPIDLYNTFAVGGFQVRLAFDGFALTPDTVLLTSRSQMFEFFGADLTEPGVANFFGTSFHPTDNFIPPGQGDIATVYFVINSYATPGIYQVTFENSNPILQENALSNTIGDSLVIPILVSGQIEVLTPESVDENGLIPLAFELTQNYPNPFNSETRISFTLNDPEYVRLTIFNIVGQQVTELYHGQALAGETVVIWDGKNEVGGNVGSGIYYYRLENTGGKSVTKRMTLLK